jgi:hypothetical protein
MIDDLKIEVDYIDDDFVDEIEIFLIPLREELEKYPEVLDEIVDCDEKIVNSYGKINDKYLREVLTPIYQMAKKNVEAHLEVV